MVPLVGEYEEIFVRERHAMSLVRGEVDLLLDMIFISGHLHEVHSLSRWQVLDPADAHESEATLWASCSDSLTFNKRDLQEAEDLGIQVLTPGEFLRIIQPTY